MVKKRKPNAHIHPHDVLIGYSGKVRHDKRLSYLKITKKYRDALWQEQLHKNEKITHMSTLNQKYKNTLSIINSLKKDNCHYGGNLSLIMELDEELRRCKRQLWDLATELDNQLTHDLNQSMKDIFNRPIPQSNKLNCRPKKTARKQRQLLETVCESTNVSDTLPINMSSKTSSVTTRSCRFACVKSQILLRNGLELETINIDLFSSGSNLYDTVASRCGHDIHNFTITFGTKKVDKGKTLWEQEIYHGCTVDLNIRLQGGMGKTKKKKNKLGGLSSEKQKNPLLWTKSQVSQWFRDICKEYEVEENDIASLMVLNGKGLNELKDKDDWIRRSPVQGDLMYNLWKKLIAEQKSETGLQLVDEELNSQSVSKETSNNLQITTKQTGDQKAKESTVEEGNRQPESSAPNEEKPPVALALNDTPVEPDEKKSNLIGPFGNGRLSDVPECIPLYDIRPGGKFSALIVDNIISVTGICKEKPRYSEPGGILLLRDDPPGAVNVFYQMEVNILGRPSNKDIYPEAVENLLEKISSGDLVAVRGRVEKSNGSMNDKSYETSSFKLVVDMDCHALIFKETRKPLDRQVSQPWYVVQGVYPCKVDGIKLNVGDTISRTSTRVFRTVIDNDEIKKFAVGFKNSKGGDIFIGVEDNGIVSGMEFVKEKLADTREKVSKTISGILPKCNEEVAICESVEDAKNSMEKCFVSFMKLGDSNDKNVEKISVIAWIHVPRGEARLYFSKPTDIHAFIRLGAETLRFNDYEELFCRLDSLSSRRIVPVGSEDIEKQCQSALEELKSKPRPGYKIFKPIKCESDTREFKMIFGDNPVEIIQRDYLDRYSNGFLNSDGGSIFFGVQEEKESKIGHVVGIVIANKERELLIKKWVTALNKFYPPVSTSQFHINFHNVSVPVEYILKHDNAQKERLGTIVVLRGPPNDIGMNWPKFSKDVLCRVICIKPKVFCIVAKKMVDKGVSEKVMGIAKKFVEKYPKVKLEAIDEIELKPILKNVCIVEVQLERSPYPIYLTKPIDTYVFNDIVENVSPLSYEQLVQRFGLDSRSDFNVEQFLGHVEHFDLSGNSFVLITSPFQLPKNERDIYGLVIPKWTLVIDLDQEIKQEGHIYQIFDDLNGLHQTERGRFIRTPQDNKLDLNPSHGICWLAACGYEEIGTSLSENAFVKWNSSHRPKLRALLESEVTKHVKPNRLNVVVLWDEKCTNLLYHLRTILEDIFCINGERISLTFVCSTDEAREDINTELVKPLQNHYWEIIQDDRVYVAPPFVLAHFLSSKLPDPYRPEDDYQVPHKKIFRGSHGVSTIVPDILPKQIRQNVHGHVDIMYMSKERKFNKTELNLQHRFYCGSSITLTGLQNSIGITRTKMTTLEREFKALSNDKKSHVSLIIVRSDRGAGATTMCLQFLFKNHRGHPCAQLIEIKDGLVSLIEDINKVTKLPLLLLVDEEIANLQDFLDFKKETERRNVSVLFLIIEPAETIFKKSSANKSTNAPLKSARDSSLYGTSPYKVVELRRELDSKEMEELTNKLKGIVDEPKKVRLSKLLGNAEVEKSLRTFAHFSLTAFGKDFIGLKDYVKLRLDLADEIQKDILAFLSLTHVYTDNLFPVSALSTFLGKNIVCLDVEFNHFYLRDLLSPPLDENDYRRISFIEVAQEILAQFAASNNCSDNHWEFIKQISVKMAKNVLSANIQTKKIDRLARKLFVTSEYETEKFSLLIRSMKEHNKDTARETLVDLVEVFEKHTSFRAHLLAHLAKYHMIVHSNFKEAKPLIEEATKDQKDDSLLHHIHGDIIRRQVDILKKQPNIDMPKIVNYAIESSECFDIVRHKRPHVSHGYISDAMVRITVMRAAIKKIGEPETSFVDYLVNMIDEIKDREDGEISLTERYLLSLIPDAHQYLDEGVIDFEHKEKWKEHFLDCIGKITNLRRLLEKLRTESSSFSSSWSCWLGEICREIQVLYNALELETKTLNPDEYDKIIDELEKCKVGERLMKCWVRYARRGRSVPPLEKVGKRVKEWVDQAKKKGGISPHAEFYNFVVNVLVALKDPKDREKMKKAAKLIKQQQGKKYNKKDVVLPLEWLHPKDAHHINSIDSLLNHDDLIKEASRSLNKYRSVNKQRPGREVIEGSLFEKQVTQWEGTVKEIKTEWQGIIVFKNYLDVRFVPQNVQPSMPSTGDKVRFCLSFDRLGLNAWTVNRAVESQKSKSLEESIISSDEESEEESNSKIVTSSLFSMDVRHLAEENTWDNLVNSRKQGVVKMINVEKGYGTLNHPDVLGTLFFHAAQLFKPVKTFEGTITKNMVLVFKVEKLAMSERLRAADIHVVEQDDIEPTLKEYLTNITDEHRSSPSTTRRKGESNVNVKTPVTQPSREEGVIDRFGSDDGSFGFIKLDNSSSYRSDIFFHRKNLVNKASVLRLGDRVQFRVAKTNKGLEANDIFVQNQYSSGKWERFVDRGIQEGFVCSTTDKGGFITSPKITGQRKLPFYWNDVENYFNTEFLNEGTKVHFEVIKKGGKCIAVKINVIDHVELMHSQQDDTQPVYQGSGFENYSDENYTTFPGVSSTGAFDYFVQHSADDVENTDEY